MSIQILTELTLLYQSISYNFFSCTNQLPFQSNLKIRILSARYMTVIEQIKAGVACGLTHPSMPNKTGYQVQEVTVLIRKLVTHPMPY